MAGNPRPFLELSPSFVAHLPKRDGLLRAPVMIGSGFVLNLSDLAPLDPLAAEADEEAFTSLTSLKQIGKRFPGEHATVRTGQVEFGGGQFVVIAGPCAVESELQIMRVAEAVSRAGGNILRGGCFKPRTSPYSFQGLGAEGLKLLRDAGDEFDMPVVSEAMTDSQVDVVAEYADIIQVGARSMYNSALLSAVGRARRPVLLKRGMTAPVEDWLQAAEQIVAAGNSDVILCERGIRTYGRLTRNTCDLTAVPLLNLLTRLPVIVDPSHATGQRALVPHVARAAVAIGADGLMVEVHSNPGQALSDGLQSLSPGDFDAMIRALNPYLEIWKQERAPASLTEARS